MTNHRHTETKVCHWDPEFAKQIGNAANPLFLNNLYAVVVHVAVRAGGSGAYQCKRRQH